MKKIVLLVAVFIAAFSSCSKDSFDPAKQAAKDDAAIQAYIAANNIKRNQRPVRRLLPGYYARYGSLPHGKLTDHGKLYRQIVEWICI